MARFQMTVIAITMSMILFGVLGCKKSGAGGQALQSPGVAPSPAATGTAPAAEPLPTSGAASTAPTDTTAAPAPDLATSNPTNAAPDAQPGDPPLLAPAVPQTTHPGESKDDAFPAPHPQ